MFPNEILYHILKELDNQDLVSCKTISRNCYEIINHIFKKRNQILCKLVNRWKNSRRIFIHSPKYIKYGSDVTSNGPADDLLDKNVPDPDRMNLIFQVFVLKKCLGVKVIIRDTFKYELPRSPYKVLSPTIHGNEVNKIVIHCHQEQPANTIIAINHQIYRYTERLDNSTFLIIPDYPIQQFGKGWFCRRTMCFMIEGNIQGSFNITTCETWYDNDINKILIEREKTDKKNLYEHDEDEDEDDTKTHYEFMEKILKEKQQN